MAVEMPRVSKPEDVGLSSQRLRRLHDALQSDVDKGIVLGAVVLVARHGKIACLDCTRALAIAKLAQPMALNTIFRIASMTKPFTSVATMMLAEEGKLLIADPVRT